VEIRTRDCPARHVVALASIDAPAAVQRKSRCKGQKGRPPLPENVVGLIKSMAYDNRTWGAERIRGELLKLGLQVSKSTIQKYKGEVRSPLSPKQSWSTFLRNHAKDIWAADFLQTHDLFFRTIFVFFIVELGSRRLMHFGVTRTLSDAWVAQQLREATPFGEGMTSGCHSSALSFRPSLRIGLSSARRDRALSYPF
jgi:putative transposase